MNFTIQNQTYNAQNTLIIAELGTSHQGDPTKAQELVCAAAEAGADCVKVQLVYADEILHPNTGLVALPGGNSRLYDRFKALETSKSFFADLKTYIESKGCLFLCTPFGIRSARELRDLQPKAVKIASPELNHQNLLEETASYRLPTLLSGGVSTLGDIETALEIMRTSNAPICLLHCITAYPAPPEEYNLRILKNLSGIFGVSIGVSDHSLDPEIVPALSVAMGAAVVEKHFCLSRNDPGLDDPIALPPAEFARMVKAVRQASAEEPGDVVKRFAQERGALLTQAVLGDGVKRQAPAETANYGRTNRSLHALRDIQAGEPIAEDMFAPLRTEKVLRPGLPPSWGPRIIGKIATAYIPAGEGIRFGDLVNPPS
ncbi:MAG: N-acetylneuraminate synthase family protein [Spirochaetaceae bacterium]|jgi:sialic acid synthase SpsE|nr:N-acetylneuraminate synthase family protein [Spirochaetaceae bacterium]